nr:RHS repeat-associated core domain-containing protein [Clostridium pasteurianum]
MRSKVEYADTTRTQAVAYTYDTWGKLISTTGTLASTVGAKNPYRYRGYRYDGETGLYYLNARYYNAEWGRFINADAYGGNVGNLLSHNVFAYCMNNQVNMSDPSGNWPTWNDIKSGLSKIKRGVSNALSKVTAWVADKAEAVLSRYASDAPSQFSAWDQRFFIYLKYVHHIHNHQIHL